jgi:predicted Fe-Mo cluster-binding NifX family protein
VRIAITSSGPTLDSQVDPRFGRARYVLIVDTDSLGVEPIENPNVAAGGGAGVQTSQMVISKSVDAVLTGNCGPNAFRTLNAADVQIYAGVSGTVRAAVEAFKRGEISSLSAPSVSGHFGTGQAGDGDARGAA